MFRKRLVSFVTALLLSLSSLFVYAPLAHAAAITWDGGGTDENFSNDLNWSGDVAPVNGDSVVFDTGTITVMTTITNDISNLSLAGITFQGSNPDSNDIFLLSGNAITLNGNVSNTTSFGHAVRMPITLGANITVSGNARVTFGDPATPAALVNISTYTLTANAEMDFYHAISGSGTITIGSAADVYFMNGASIFSGTINVNGALVTYESSAIDDVTSIVIADNATVEINFSDATGEVIFNPSFVLNGDGKTGEYPEAALKLNLSDGITNLKLPNVTFNANTTYYSNAEADQKVTMTATLNSFSLSRLAGSQGILTVNGQDIESAYSVDTYTSPDDDNTTPGTETIEDKEKVIFNNQTVDNITVQKGGILGGKGKVGTITLENGAKLAPGESPGCLSSGNLTFVAGSTYEFEVAGPTPCTEYDQTKVTGTVTLGNGTLSTVLLNSFKPVAGQTYMIIENDLADAVSGTFLNLAEGATFTVGGYVLKISYVGGDGNDVVLTVQSVPAVPNTGFQVVKNNPLLTLIATSTIAGAMLVLARKYQYAIAKR